MKIPGSIPKTILPRTGGDSSSLFRLVANTSTAARSAFCVNSDLTCRTNNG